MSSVASPASPPSPPAPPAPQQQQRDTSCNTFGAREARDCLAAFPRGRRYQVIYADPPWRYESDGNLSQKPYPTMSFEELAALPVAAVAAPDAAVFMWTSNPMLDKAIALMAAWGFAYKTVFKVWTKRSAGGAPARVPGYWSLSSVELVLVGSRGAMQKYKCVHDEQQEFAAPRGLHSEKPACVRDSIRRLLDVPERLELFSRHICDGWDAWGLDVPGYFHRRGALSNPSRAERVRVALVVAADGGDAPAVRCQLWVRATASRGEQTRTLTMRKPTYGSPSSQSSSSSSSSAARGAAAAAAAFAIPPKTPSQQRPQQRAPNGTAVAVASPSSPSAIETETETAAGSATVPPPRVGVRSGATGDRVPVSRGDLIVRGPARPSRRHFREWWNAFNREAGRYNRELYTVDAAYLELNADVRAVVEARR